MAGIMKKRTDEDVEGVNASLEDTEPVTGDPAPGESGPAEEPASHGGPSPEPASTGDTGPRPESVVEALLMAADAPLPGAKIAEILGTGTAADVRKHVEALNDDYERRGAAFRVESIAKGYQVLTLPLYDRWISKLRKVRAESRLSAAALETLAVIAYKQPVMRADIEAVRGVAAGDILLRLREMRLIKIVGRAEEVGRPLLYGTTNTFLDVFGLGSLKDLPPIDADQPDAVPKLRVAREANGDGVEPPKTD